MSPRAPRLRAFLVDDEELALGHLAELLEETGRVEIVGRATRAVARKLAGTISGTVTLAEVAPRFASSDNLSTRL